MPTQFSETFSKLRRERGLSQRRAAEDLKISQALLSHYENGIREPRLDFVIRACEYYGVSADYLLGRTTAKENPMAAERIFSGDDFGDEALRNNANMRNFISFATLVFRIIRDRAGERAADSAVEYVSMGVFKLLKHLDIYDDEAAADVLSMPEAQFYPLCEAATRTAEAKLAAEMEAAEKDDGGEYAGKLKSEFPNTYSAVNRLVEKACSRITEIQERI